MHAHQYVSPISDIAADKSDMRFLVDLILKCVKPELSVFGGQVRGGYTFYQRLRTSPVGNQVSDGDHQQIVPACERTELGHAGHGAILVHDFADDARRMQASQASQVYRGFGLPGSHQHSSAFWHATGRCGRANEIRRFRSRVNCRKHSGCTIGRRNSGSGTCPSPRY